MWRDVYALIYEIQSARNVRDRPAFLARSRNKSLELRAIRGGVRGAHDAATSIMQIPVEITFKEMESSDAVEARIRELAAKLERVYDRVVRCDVMVETPHRHQQKGRQFHIRVRLTVPGGEIVSSHDPGPDEHHEDVYVALRDAFNAAKRQLEDHSRKSLKRGEGAPKERAGTDHGRITFLDVEKAWGWIEPDDGRRIYFHRNSVLGNVNDLTVGDEVRFTEEMGDKGPQASSVHLLGAHGRHALPNETGVVPEGRPVKNAASSR